MNRSAIEDVNNANNNLGNTLIMSESKLDRSVAAATEVDDPPGKINDGEILTTVRTEPKFTDGERNMDEVNPATRTIIDNANLLVDQPDRRNRSGKPLNYAAKKTVAQGMMDIALITSNANQLKSLIDYQTDTRSYHFVLFMIILSLVLQVGVGVTLIFKGRFDTKGKDKAAATRVNKWIMSAVFVITVINIFIAVFSTGPQTPSAGPGNRTSV